MYYISFLRIPLSDNVSLRFLRMKRSFIISFYLSFNGVQSPLALPTSMTYMAVNTIHVFLLDQICVTDSHTMRPTLSYVMLKYLTDAIN